MSVTVAAPSAGGTFVAWDPTARQIVEPDTTYLMDPDAESQLTTLAQGRMIEGYAFGTDLPPWMGGTKVAIVPGKYRKAFKCVSDPTYGFVALPSSGLLGSQGTIEMFVQSDVDWNTLSFTVPFRFFNDASQYIEIMINAATMRVDYRHNQDAAGEVFVRPSFAAVASAGQWVSVAVTLLAGTMKVYLDGVLKSTSPGCTPPRLWNDNWLASQGIAVSVGSTHLAVSDLRISRLARVPGVLPAP